MPAAVSSGSSKASAKLGLPSSLSTLLPDLPWQGVSTAMPSGRECTTLRPEDFSDQAQGVKRGPRAVLCTRCDVVGTARLSEALPPFTHGRGSTADGGRPKGGGWGSGWAARLREIFGTVVPPPELPRYDRCLVRLGRAETACPTNPRFEGAGEGSCKSSTFLEILGLRKTTAKVQPGWRRRALKKRHAGRSRASPPAGRGRPAPAPPPGPKPTCGYPTAGTGGGPAGPAGQGGRAAGRLATGCPPPLHLPA